MTDSPLALTVVFHIGPVPVTQPVVVTWGIIALMAVLSFALRRSLALRPSWPQAVVELVVSALDSQIRATIPGEPARFRALIGTLLLFILIANWSSLVPGVEPPTAHLETDAALALIVFFAAIYFGIREQGVRGYLASFARPTWVMIPLNLIEQVTRAFSLMVRLFGNVMSGVFVIGIILSLAGLLVPIPLMALDLLTGAVQAYIFATLALVFIAAAVEDGTPNKKENRP
ncbi:F0F1 ATP synthase subunit A [Zhengella sp. ZM62]|uniref:F0F1 ATP synthase subunit A n=1 Tax=Zhengella sedimenti TaxID=3390035 RepID=UPI003975E15F